ncbi:Putative Aspergillus niger contig An14c0130, genomic contig [Aspergillus calidoustus]|uniref:Putative Aspergillus niger contig An14c0130, genomic contig n=1 Tax=Aspergillus calidoustus TaxID=454130 RepID=A0A0U5FWM6_ASPCI|nr:Putative Aspergillus niger contig An14c0130, genomic contig [Aspergillus calidoustus]
MADNDNPQDASNSASSLVVTLIPALAVAVAMVALFVILRRSERRMYMPRTYLGVLRESERTPPSSTGLVNWLRDMYKLPDEYVLLHHSMDAYLLLRFLKIVTVICFVGCLITWPVLFPLNATGGNGMKQLDILSFSNVSDQNYAYLFGHALIAWIFVGFVFFTVTRESLFYINLRQAYSLSRAYASRLSSRTVLFTSVPQDYLSREKITRMFGANKVKNVWLTTDTAELSDMVDEREKAAMKLEAAETKLIRKANGARLKKIKKGGNAEDPAVSENTTEDDGESGSVAARWVKPTDRPTHRLKPVIGKKVDTINWARSEIERLNPEIEKLQGSHRAGEVDLVSSVFVEFYEQADAQAAYQSVAHNLPLHMAPRYIGLEPTQIIWSNLRIKWWERIVRYAASIAFVCALVIFWAIPTAFVGSLSNINNLTDMVPFLRFIDDVPSWIKGAITGLLPTILMAVLMALLPIVLRLMAKIGGAPSLAAVELTTQNFYFLFQVVQVFLVVTLASSATSVVTKIIDDPTSAASLLANKLPTASNFYISYIVLQGLSFSSGALLQIVGLILGKVLGRILDNTPRKMYSRWSNLSGLGWGTVYPIFTLLAVIAITYSCIAPLVLGFASIGLYLFYFAYRYNLLYVSNANIDTQGKNFARGLQHITVGCYLLVGCLIGLFAIATGAARIALGPLVLMIILLIFMIIYHVSLNQALDPLINYLPKNLEAEEEALLSREATFASTANGDEHDGIAATSSAANGHDNGRGTSVGNVDSAEKGLTQTAPVQPKVNFFAKYLRPDKYASYEQLRRWVPSGAEATTYAPEVEENAYYHPCISAQPPLLWIPRDEMGISRQEVRHTGRVIPITDEDAWLDEKNHIVWNVDKGVPPIFEEKVYY